MVRADRQRGGTSAPGRMAGVLLTITSTAPTASDLGYLLHKHPDRVQQTSLSVGTAHVFYPESNDARCTVALMLEVDPVGMVREKRFSAGDASLAQYVNDRPYAATSLLSVALNKVFRTAMTGVCKERPELVDQRLPLEVHVASVPVGDRPDLPELFFAPLGWQVRATPRALDTQIPAWGPAPHVDLALRGELRLADALTHLYVLLPAIAAAKHYWVSRDEVDKLLRVAAGWLPGHPQRDLISSRYLAYQRDLVRSAAERLAELDDTEVDEPESDLDTDAATRTSGAVSTADARTPASSVPEAAPVPLNVLRKTAVIAELTRAGSRRVVDLGCGAGALLRDLLADPRFTEVVGVDVSARALALAERRLGLDRMPDSVRARLSLLQSSLTYQDSRLAGFDAIVLMEVVEHLDPPRLPALVATVFGSARPSTVVVTTPNAEFNVRYASLPAGAMRHRDHRFEWTRGEFRAWADAVCAARGYDVRVEPVGALDDEVGAPTQLAVFTRRSGSSGAAA